MQLFYNVCFCDIERPSLITESYQKCWSQSKIKLQKRTQESNEIYVTKELDHLVI